MANVEEGSKTEHSFGAIIATIGSILIGMGFAWLLALNWNDIPSALKVLILIIATSISYGAGAFLRIKDYKKIGGSLLILGALLYTLSIFLIAQIFNLPVTIQWVAFFWFLAFIGVVAASYIFNSSPSLVIGLVWFLAWIRLQYWSFSVEGSRGGLEAMIPFISGTGSSFGLLAILYLLIGIFFYGLNLLHQSKGHKFAKIYGWWVSFYFLVFAYILSFKMLLPMIWPSGFSAPGMSIIFLVVLALIAIITFCIGVFMELNNNKLDSKEILAFLGIVFLLVIVILSASLVSNTLGNCYQKSCFDLKTENECSSSDLPNSVCNWENNRCNQDNCFSYQDQISCSNAPSKLRCTWENNRCNGNRELVERGSTTNACTENNNQRDACLSNNVCKWDARSYIRGDIPFKLWAVWIVDNIIFIFIILLTVGYGIKKGSTKIVNLGIIFFVLDIITRYIGFIIDFGGQTGFAVMSIIGGIILIFGGLGVEKLRRRLIKETEEHKTPIQNGS